MTVESRKAIYAEVERIREEIDNAFYNWRSQDISVGQERPTIEDLIAEIETVLSPPTDVKSHVTHIGRMIERDGKVLTVWEAI